MMTRNDKTPPIAPRLSLWDAISIIVGIVVGTAIFKSPMMVFQNTDGAWQALAAWFLGGVLSLCGALCYAELATSYPRDGGDYEYLNRAFGRGLGFLFGWCQLTVILSASIGTIAYAFAEYAVATWPALAAGTTWLAVAAVVSLALLNAMGNVVGTTTQNLLTAAKLLGLLSIALIGAAIAPATAEAAPAAASTADSSFGLAVVFVLYAFGGWSDAAFVAAEVRDQRRNLPRALLLGTLVVTLLYLAVNAAYVRVLGIDAARLSPTPAADVFQVALGDSGRVAISFLVMLSALGAIHGMILTGSRVYATLGEDYPIVNWLATWNTRRGVPVVAIVTQCVAAVMLVVAVGTSTGRTFVDRALGYTGATPLPWDDFFGGFETLLAASAPVFWSFFLLTGLSVFVLRWREPNLERPFRIPLYPLPPLVFCATCLYMIYASLDYAGWLALLGVVPVLFGGVLFVLLKRRQTSP